MNNTKKTNDSSLVKEYGESAGGKYEQFDCWSFLIWNVETKTHDMKYVATEDQIPHNALFWRVGYVKMVRKGDWKLNFNEKEGLIFLHNLKDDPFELNNLADQNPQKVEELKQALAEWEKQFKPSNWRYSLDAKIEDGRGQRFYFPW